MGFFNFDSPVMVFLGKACEYMLVAIMCLIFCIPIVTVGAALTAQYYVGIKLIRGEDVPFFRAYIKSFKENFKQATIIWLIELAVGLLLAYDWYLYITVGSSNYNFTLIILLAVVTLFFLMASIAVFALIARFEMSTKEAIKGALVYTYTNVPRMLCVLILTVLPTLAGWKYFNWLIPIWPVGSAMCLYLIGYNFNKSFKKLEEHVLGEDLEDTVQEADN